MPIVEPIQSNVHILDVSCILVSGFFMLHYIRVYIILWKQALVELLQFSFFIAVAVHGTAI